MKLPTALTRAVGTATVKTKKNAPHIYFAGGLLGVVTSTVLACRATLRLEETVDDIREDVGKTKALETVTNRTEYSQSLVQAYIRSAVKIGRLYGPSALIMSVSLAALTKSHVEMNRRNAALTAAYAGLSQVFDEYRERVKQELGEERENQIYLNAKEIAIEEDGKKVKALAAEGLPNQNARFFDRNNPNWKPDANWNRYFLLSQQNYANDRLHAYGSVMLNDIYDWLGFDRTPNGAILGWVINGEGAGYIDFGLNDHLNVRNSNALEWSTLLDFNLDGVVWDKI